MAGTNAQVRGMNTVIKFYDGGFYKGFVCATDQGITKKRDFVETAVSGAGLAKTQAPAGYSWGVTGAGIVALEIANTLSVADLTAFWLAGTRLYIRYERLSEDGKTYVDKGYIYINSIDETGSYNGMETFNFVLDGDGPIVQDFIPSPIIPPGMSHRIDFPSPTLGSDTVSSGLLVGKYILEANKDGVGSTQIITTGSPSGKQALYNSAAGTIKFSQTFDTGEQAYVVYQDM